MLLMIQSSRSHLFQFTFTWVAYLACSACSHIPVDRDMEVTDANTKSRYFEIGKKLRYPWQANGFYLAAAGGQTPSLQLNSHYPFPDSDDPILRKEAFSLDQVYFESPVRPGSVMLGTEYDLEVLGAELQRPFSPAYPFDVDFNFGIQFLAMELEFFDLAGNDSQHLDINRVYPKLGMDFNYALTRTLSINAFGEFGHDFEWNVFTIHRGIAFVLRPAEVFEISARAYTFSLDYKTSGSDLEIDNNGTVIGVKLNF